MVRAYIGLGSNLGQREDFIERAIAGLTTASGVCLLRRAGLYETEPVGVAEQPWFLNTVIEIEAALSPRALLALCQQIEQHVGRPQRERSGPREMDLDILLYGQLVLDEPDLQIPHAELHRRRFVLVPLAELAPTELHPKLKRTIADLLNNLQKNEAIAKEVIRYDQRDSH